MKWIRSKRIDQEQRSEALHSIAVELMRARDTHDLLLSIVNKAVQLLQCDAGSLYLKKDEETLVFEVAENCTENFALHRTEIPVSGNGIAAYVFRTGQGLLIDDVYQIEDRSPYHFNSRFDDLTGYRTKSVLAQPLVSSKMEKLGVLQLINRKHKWQDSWPAKDDTKALEKMPAFTDEDAELLSSFSALASASIEKANLYKSIENLFKGFVRASVKVIEERDPATRGHSHRVAVLTVDLARRISESRSSGLSTIVFNERQIEELNYASILHDFGKVNVKEATLLKSKKLYPDELAQIRTRMDHFEHAEEILLLRELLVKLKKEERGPSDFELVQLEKRLQNSKKDFNERWTEILGLNEPTLLDDDKSSKLNRLKELAYRLVDGRHRSLLDPAEVVSLGIRRGSLTDEERREIETHVTQTYHFLQEIPWTTEFNNVAEIAYGHHEKLDGTGYPRGLQANDIPIQSRIMTICDIYDALVAADRPYKKAVPVEKALDILSAQSKSGELDERFFRLFVEAKVFDNPDFIKLNRRQKAAA